VIHSTALAIAAGDDRSPSRYPTIPPEHTHARALLDNAMHYVASATKLVDPVSGYPHEGWNKDPARGVFLTSFTQLTAIGQYMELLANVVAGNADTPDLPRDKALAGLAHLVETLRRDQRDPTLSAKGLLVNFLDLETGKRLGPLASDVQKKEILSTFGDQKGEALWAALAAKGWIAPRNKDREAQINRADRFGWDYFDGPLAPYRDDATKKKVLGILDERVVLVVFGDNANLSTSVAKTIGALLTPGIADRPEVVAIRRSLEEFLDAQKDGYAHLYDAKAGLFNFGWDVKHDRLFGWEDLQGNWTIGHMDYFVNEFRGPATFVDARFGLPSDAIRNLGFKMKSYTLRDGRTLIAPAPWEGSAFQALGLGISLLERESPSWRELLRNVVAIELDFASRHGLPGFLSESYTGNGVQYTGAVGIPEITVSPKPRITNAASLYCLGPAYAVAPEEVERFLAANWVTISSLFTEHGPWEGYNATKKEPIKFQTTAHTLALALGLIGTGPDNMRRYAEHTGISARLAEHFRPSAPADLLSAETNVFAWANKDGQIRSGRKGESFHVEGEQIGLLGIAFVPKSGAGVDLSGGHLRVRYRSSGAIDPLVIELKPAGVPADAGLIPKQVFARFADTGGREEEIIVPLPATVGLARIKEVVFSHEKPSGSQSIDLTVTGVRFTPSKAID
jgi:hypothetical protein